MTSKILIVTAALVLSGAAYAAVDAVALDADGDGKITVEEVLGVYMTLTGDEVVALDSNGDGYLDVSELKAADDAGMLPMSSE